MEDIIRVQDQFYVLATSSLADQRTRVLKDGDTFAVFDVSGDIQPIGQGSQGIYDESTRFISHFELRLKNGKPLLLSSTVRDADTHFTVDLTNPDMKEADGASLPRGTLHFHRSKFLHDRTSYEELRITNFGLGRVEIDLSFRFDSDYADLFEVRGISRKHRGHVLKPELRDSQVVLSYEGLDGVLRNTRLRFDPRPGKLEGHEAHYRIALDPHESQILYITLSCEIARDQPVQMNFDGAFKEAQNCIAKEKDGDCILTSTNLQFNEFLRRSADDLRMMTTETPYGLYPYAGIPWYNTVFGRDGIIAALQSLWVNSEIARGVLRYLAAYQATELNAIQDAEPGKVLHETRQGEMVALGEVPFQRYYGSIDSTPLFIVLAAEYYRATGDRALIESLWGHIERGLDWMDTYGDPDGDGFIEYQRKRQTGLSNQGWKDSEDSVMHADGSLAQGPIALCEVQGYAYRAKIGASEMALALGLNDRHEFLKIEAEALRKKFNEAFWLPEFGTYALALDGQKKPCRVRSSNAGHCLFSGIADERKAEQVVQSLMSPEMFSGWGIRTLSTREKRYNPMSYHNGSIWPHDNSIAVEGFARYGHKEAVVRVLGALFDTSMQMDLHRLPELFCGFIRRNGEGPTLYPVACSPQAWASGSVFMLIRAALGLEIDGLNRRVKFHHPILPEFLPELRIQNLRVGGSKMDLLLRRSMHDVGIHVLSKSGPVEINLVH
jgi:glycogen debranching enzyme